MTTHHRSKRQGCVVSSTFQDPSPIYIAHESIVKATSKWPAAFFKLVIHGWPQMGKHHKPWRTHSMWKPLRSQQRSLSAAVSMRRAQHEYIRSHGPNRTGFYNKKQARPKHKKSYLGVYWHHAPRTPQMQEISRTLSSVALFLSSELPPSTPAVGYFLVFAALDTAKGSSSTITAQFSSTGQSSRHQAQKTHGIAGKKTHIFKRQKQSCRCLFHVSAT